MEDEAHHAPLTKPIVENIVSVHEKLKGQRESLAAEQETQERKSMRETKIKEAQKDNPYPNQLRD